MRALAEAIENWLENGMGKDISVWQQRERLKTRFADRKRPSREDQVQFDVQFKKQGKKCAICKSSTHKGRGWHADHDHHKTMQFRGVLCSLCNTGLLCAAIKYLQTTDNTVIIPSR